MYISHIIKVPFEKTSCYPLEHLIVSKFIEILKIFLLYNFKELGRKLIALG